MHARHILFLLAFGLLLGTLACSDTSTPAADAGTTDGGDDEMSMPHDGTIADGDDAQVKLSYTLAAPLARSGNVFSAHVTDAAGAAITGAFVEWEFTGPSEGLATAGTTTELGGGDYRSSTVDFAAGGDWILKIHVENDTSGLHDHASFKLTVP